MRTLFTLALLLAAGWGMAQTPQMAGVEYWFDQDHGARVFVDMPSGVLLNGAHSPELTGLSVGPHRIYYRLKDSAGRWSSVIGRRFTIHHAGPHHIVLLRYWSDPHVTAPSDMTVVEVAPPMQYLDIIDGVLFCNWSTTGQSSVYFQLKDNHGQWSSVVKDTINVDLVTGPPEQPGEISGPFAPPFGSTQTYFIAGVSDAGTYYWTLPNGWTGDTTGTSITIQAGDTNDGSQLCARAVNGCGASDPVCLQIITSVATTAGADGMGLWPNPTSGNFTLRVTEHVQARDLAVLDATGRFVLSQPLANASGPVAVDLSGHESGVYFVQVRFVDGTRAVERLVKE